MIAVILAAGLSKRLRPLTNKIPKCLLSVGEETLLSRYLRILEKSGVEKTIIVTGFNAEAVAAEVAQLDTNMPIECVYNAAYQNTTPIEGLLVVKYQLLTEKDDFLLLNSDVYFLEESIKLLIQSPNSGVLIDSAAAFIPDEMFVNFDDAGHVTEISKKLFPKASHQGKSVQVTKFLKEDALSFLTNADAIASNEGVQYPAEAFDILIKSNRFFAIDSPNTFSQELDTVEDYNTLLHYLKISHHETSFD